MREKTRVGEYGCGKNTRRKEGGKRGPQHSNAGQEWLFFEKGTKEKETRSRTTICKSRDRANSKEGIRATCSKTATEGIKASDTVHSYGAKRRRKKREVLNKDCIR